MEITRSLRENRNRVTSDKNIMIQPQRSVTAMGHAKYL
jgi:hypothetical protein